MFMITKFEAIGILSSVALMAVALFLLRVDGQQGTLSEATGETQSAAVVVGEGKDVTDEAALKQALVKSFDGMESQQKLVIDDVKVGTGAEAVAGKTVVVHYVGRLTNGQEFDSSKKRGEPFSFTLGEGRVIAGWEQGVLGMKVGGERTLVIPPQLGYGSQNVGPIPANSTLLFSIELLEVK